MNSEEMKLEIETAIGMLNNCLSSAVYRAPEALEPHYRGHIKNVIDRLESLAQLKTAQEDG